VIADVPDEEASCLPEAHKADLESLLRENAPQIKVLSGEEAKDIETPGR
jgi:hypothetical protein